MTRLPAVLLAITAVFAQKAPPPVILADRVPLPAGYGSEQDTESDATFDFASAAGVKGHILRRYVQAGDDKTSAADLVAYFADEVHRQNGVVLMNRFNNLTGRLDGRIPGARPLWLHIEVSDEGGVIDVVLLDERQPVARDVPVEETAVAGTWSSESPIGDRLAPILQPYRGWAWHVVADDANHARLFGFARTQACATCAVVTDTTQVTVATFDLTQKGKPSIPSRNGGAEVSLYQDQLIDRILAARLDSAAK